MRWAEIEVIISDSSGPGLADTNELPDEGIDLVANVLIEEGCGGVAITGPSVRAAGWADVPPPEKRIVTGYLPVEDRLEGRLRTIRERIDFLAGRGIGIGPSEVTIRWVEDSDWSGAWKSFFKPLEVGRILVKPSWEEVEPRPGQVVVEIDPGMAFGTGNHPTTKLCLLALQKHVRGGERVMDVGTGSGILAIAAAKLGAARVTATEIDRAVAEVARDNVRRNAVAGQVGVVEVESDSPAGEDRSVDVAVVNITADAIIDLAPELVRVVAPGGVLIVSGLVEERAREVAARLAEPGFTQVERMVDEGWIALVLRRAPY